MSASSPTHFAVIFDYSSKTFRNELYAEYKANRSAPPEDLIPQFGLIRQATRAFNLPCIEMEGFEADDLIATYARLACEAGGDTTIISSDKDLMQLVGPTVSMYDPMKDAQIGVPEVIEKWGVPPEKMIDLQALTGDSVDNVPGVPGIGPKTAAQLLEQFGDLDTLLARAGEIKQEKRRESIIANADKARISRELVTLKNDVPVADGLDDFVLQPPDGPKLIAFLKAMEFTTLTRRVAEATGTEAAEIEAAAVAVETRRRGAWARCRLRIAGRGEPARRPELQARIVLPQTARSRPMLGGTPAALAAARAEAAVGAARSTIDGLRLHPRPADARPTGSPRRAKPGIVALRHRDHLARSDAGRIWSASRWPSRPGRAAYVPLAHRPAPATCSAAGRSKARSRSARRSPLLKPLLEDPSVLKIAQNVKYELRRAAPPRHRHRALRRHDADLLCARRRHRRAHAATALPTAGSATRRIPFKDVAGTRQGRRVSFDQVDIDSATRLCRRGRRRHAAALARAEAAPRRQGPGLRLRAAGAAAGAGAGPHGAARHLGRPADPVAAVGRAGAGRGARWRTRSTRWPASASTSARPSSSATSCSAAWACPAAPRPRPGSGRPPRRCWRNSPPRATNCRARSSTGAS